MKAKEGVIKAVTLPNGRYDYDEQSVYQFLNKDIDRKIVILRKVIGNSFIDNRYRLLAAQPLTVNPL